MTNMISCAQNSHVDSKYKSILHKLKAAGFRFLTWFRIFLVILKWSGD